MIDFVFTAEFDINKGVDISGVFPKIGEITNTYVIASYMLPDGCHLHKEDITIFRCQI